MHKKVLNRDRASFFVITLPALLLYSFFYIYSVVLGFYYSMTDWDGLSRKFNFVWLENYGKILKNKAFFNSVTVTFRYAILMVVFTIVIGVLWYWNDFQLPLFLLNRSRDMWTLPLFQYNFKTEYSFDYPMAFTAYIISLLPVLVVYCCCQKYIISGLTAGAVKS